MKSSVHLSKAILAGTESVEQYVELIDTERDYRYISQFRQASESIKFLCQLSYLHTSKNDIFATLDPNDAADIFEAIEPIDGSPLPDGDAEIQRIASCFRHGTLHDIFDYPHTALSDASSSGFIEGSRAKKSHMVIERNASLRTLFFEMQPTSTCEACEVDTHTKYPWTERVLDLHHLLPLASGTRVDSRLGTLLEDLRAICPTCHRSIHRFYDAYLGDKGRSDFLDKEEAVLAYNQARDSIVQA